MVDHQEHVDTQMISVLMVMGVFTIIGGVVTSTPAAWGALLIHGIM
jgi:hypothetical protein